jgi:hypothetical protein
VIADYTLNLAPVARYIKASGKSVQKAAFDGISGKSWPEICPASTMVRIVVSYMSQAVANADGSAFQTKPKANISKSLLPIRQHQRPPPVRTLRTLSRSGREMQ